MKKIWNEVWYELTRDPQVTSDTLIAAGLFSIALFFALTLDFGANLGWLVAFVCFLFYRVERNAGTAQDQFVEQQLAALEQKIELELESLRNQKIKLELESLRKQ